MPTHLAESLTTHISLLTAQTQTVAGSGAQGHLAEHLLPHLFLLALHNQQLTQLTIQLKESLENSQCTIKELKQENEALRQGVNENVRNEIAQLIMEKEKEMKTLEASLRQVAITESESLKQEVAELRRLEEEDRASLETVQQYTGVFPIKLMMTNFAEIKRSDGEWYSPPFYTHPQGYKMCLKVNANGRGGGEGTHVSVYAYLI